MKITRGIVVFLIGLFIEAIVFVLVPNLESIMSVTALIFLSSVIAASSSNTEVKK